MRLYCLSYEKRNKTKVNKESNTYFEATNAFLKIVFDSLTALIASRTKLNLKLQKSQWAEMGPQASSFLIILKQI